ncbi:MAG TPA: AraC family ligand binding domain-containing protein [Gaiellaceae bacterium]|nr:AraC family ligand binding domain-containing protein [Gaiellaceae bacterium]
MQVLRRKTFVVPFVALLAGAILAAVAAAAVTSRQVLGEGEGLRYRFERVVTDAAGFDSGWHVHPGLVIVQIESGSVQFYQGSCTARTLGPGDTLIEVPWKPARFVAPGSATWTTSLIVPTGQQLSVGQSAYSPQQANPCP